MSAAQPDLHAVEPHTNGAHAAVVWLQVPAPLQVPTLVSLPEAQDGEPHVRLEVG